MYSQFQKRRLRKLIRAADDFVLRKRLREENKTKYEYNHIFKVVLTHCPRRAPTLRNRINTASASMSAGKYQIKSNNWWI
jgi:hypothetical protein